MMRRRFLGVSALLAIMTTWALTGCAPPAATVQSERIEGLRTDPDDRGLVASYTGGACDGRARLVLTESETRIVAKVLVEDKSGKQGCVALGIVRIVAARLAEPIGERSIWSAGREYVPFDGSQLLTSPAWPTGFGGAREEAGRSRPQSSSADEPIVTESWVISRFDAGPSPTGGGCPATRGILDLQIGPVSPEHSSGRVTVGRARIGTAVARLYRYGSAAAPDGWMYVWNVDHRRIALSNSIDCSKQDRLLTPAELLRVAASLRPA